MSDSIKVSAQVTFFNANIIDSEACYATADHCVIRLKDLQDFNTGKLKMLPVEAGGYVYYIQGQDINQIQICNP